MFPLVGWENGKTDSKRGVHGPKVWSTLMYMHMYILNSTRHVINQVRTAKPPAKKAKKDLSDDVVNLSDSESEKPLKATSKAAAVSILFQRNYQIKLTFMALNQGCTTFFAGTAISEKDPLF